MGKSFRRGRDTEENAETIDRYARTIAVSLLRDKKIRKRKRAVESEAKHPIRGHIALSL